jgi:hypothetical protein
VQALSGVLGLGSATNFSKALSLRPLIGVCYAHETTKLRNLPIAGKSKQSLRFELSDDAVIG